MSRKRSSPASVGEGGGGGGNAQRCRLDVSLKSREWKKVYFGDRPPRLEIKLVNPPPSLSSLTVKAFTSFIGDVPVITTKKKTVVCDRKSEELRVKQMQCQAANKCMRSWTHCFALRGHELVEDEATETVFRCGTGKALNDWVHAIRNNANKESVVWLKTEGDEESKMHLFLRNGVLVLRENANASGSPIKKWNVVDRQGKPAIAAAKYAKQVVLNRSNDFSSCVSFAFQTGRYGAQVFNIEPQGANPPCGSYESPVFSVTSCNRHPPRSPLLQAQADAAIAAQHERAQQQHQQMLQHQALQQLQQQQRQQQQQQHHPHHPHSVAGLLRAPLVSALGNDGQYKSGGQVDLRGAVNRKRRVVGGGGGHGGNGGRQPGQLHRSPRADNASAQREFDKKVRRRTHSYVGAGGEHVHRGSDVPNAAFAGAVTSPGAGQFMSHPPAQFQAADHRTLVDDAISRLQRVSFSEDGQSRAFRMPSSASSTSLSDLSPGMLAAGGSSNSLSSLGLPTHGSLDDLNELVRGSSFGGNGQPWAGRTDSAGEDDVVNALFALGSADYGSRNGSGGRPPLQGSRKGGPPSRSDNGNSLGRNGHGSRAGAKVAAHGALPGRDGAHSPQLSTSTSFKPQEDWLPDASVKRCCTSGCQVRFGFLQRRHHCRVCGKIFCKNCCPKRDAFFGKRVCADCANTLPGAEGGAASSAIGLVVGQHHQLEQNRRQFSQSAPASAGMWDFDHRSREHSTSSTGEAAGPRSARSNSNLSQSDRRLSGSDLFAMGLSSGNGTFDSQRSRSGGRVGGGSGSSLDLGRMFPSGRTDSGSTLGDDDGGVGSVDVFSPSVIQALAQLDSDDEDDADFMQPPTDRGRSGSHGPPMF